MPTPKRPSPKERKQLGELLREPVAQPPGTLTLRFDKGPAPARALKALEVDDPNARKLADHLQKRREEIVRRVAEDRDLAELLVNDPNAALKALDVPEELIPKEPSALRAELKGRVREVALGFGAVKQIPNLDGVVFGAQGQSIALLTAAMDIVAANPSRSAEFTTNPLGILTEAAQTALPGGTTAAARASVVNDVLAALDDAAGRVRFTTPAQLQVDASILASIPFQPRA